MDPINARLKTMRDRVAHGGSGPAVLRADRDAQERVLEQDKVRAAFEATVEEGYRRLHRTWPGLLATGMVGGIDVALGVFGILLVTTMTGNRLLGGLAFAIGFVALMLAKSELFTENFLVPVAAAVARKTGPLPVLRLWAATAVANLIGAWIMMGIVLIALPQLGHAAVEVGVHFYKVGIGLRSFFSAVLGGVLITLMTWMERGTESILGKIVAAVMTAFLLATGGLFHAIVLSVDMFAALHAGAPFGYLDWFKLFLWASLPNILGGIGFVTVLRLAQVGWRRIERERETAQAGTAPEDVTREHGEGGT